MQELDSTGKVACSARCWVADELKFQVAPLCKLELRMDVGTLGESAAVVHSHLQDHHL
jgi:hypothetical protein